MRCRGGGRKLLVGGPATALVVRPIASVRLTVLVRDEVHAWRKHEPVVRQHRAADEPHVAPGDVDCSGFTLHDVHAHRAQAVVASADVADLPGRADAVPERTTGVEPPRPPGGAPDSCRWEELGDQNLARDPEDRTWPFGATRLPQHLYHIAAPHNGQSTANCGYPAKAGAPCYRWRRPQPWPWPRRFCRSSALTLESLPANSPRR